MNIVGILHSRAEFATFFLWNDSSVLHSLATHEEGLQANETVLFCLYLGGIDNRHLGWVKSLHRRSRGWGGGAAAATLVTGLVPWVIDKAVGSRLKAVLDIDSQLCGFQRPLITIREHT